MIHVQGLNHQFEIGKRAQKTIVPVLHGIDLSVKKGEVVTIVGRSGSGKSTLLHAISGYIHPKEGDIHLNGRLVSGFNERQWADFRLSQLGFIFQHFQLIPSMTAYENVELPLVLKGVSEADRTKRTRDMLEKVGLLPYKDHYPGELSGGQQQRVSIARAVIGEPPLILADEPTGSLDSDTEREILTIIQQLNVEAGITFLIITHDEKVAAIGERTLTMADGRLREGALV